MTGSVKLAMTAGEIVTRYRQAKDKRGQIKILAQLNACPAEVIKQVLSENGLDISDLPVLRKKWTLKEEGRLRQLAAEGLTCEQIGKELIRTGKAVREKAERMHVSIRQPEEEEKLKEEAEERLQAMFDKAIAQDTEASITAPATKEKREQKSWTPEEEELLLKLVAEGRDHQEIGEALDRSAGSIKHKLKHMKKVQAIPRGSSVFLTSDAFAGMVTAAIGQELHAGAEARLVDMLSALGYMVMRYFAGDTEAEHVRA